MSEAIAVVSLEAFLAGEQTSPREVLSSSTGNLDGREKAVAYGECRSLQLLVLVDPNIRRVEVARPVDGVIQDWAVFGAGDLVATSYGDLDIDALYDAIDRTATTA